MKRIIFFVFFGLGGFAVLVSLGTWQIQRLTWKQEIIEQIEGGLLRHLVALPATLDSIEDKYLSVSVEGFMKPEVLRVLVSQKTVGAGYRLISPFMVDGGTILVDRGFISVNDPLTGTVTVAGANGCDG